MRLHELQDVFTMQLAELRSAETQLIDALPRLAAASGDADLRELLLGHHEQTRRHRLRLDVVIRAVEAEAVVPDRDSESMRTLIREAVEVVGCEGPDFVRDAALIAAVRRIEHLEIASYASVEGLARDLYYRNAERSFHDTVAEERETDERLAQIAAGAEVGQVGGRAGG